MPMAHTDAERGILWAKAVIAHVQHDKDAAIKCADDIKQTMDVASPEIREQLVRASQDKRSCASVLDAIENRFMGMTVFI